MWVCTSIKPGRPVYAERSMTSAPAGTADASEDTLRILLSSRTTTALVHNLPLPSHNLPKRTARTIFAAGFSCGHMFAASAMATQAPKINRFHRMKPSSRRHTSAAPNRLLIQLEAECNRDSRRELIRVQCLVALGGLRGTSSRGGRRHRRHGRRDSGGLRTEAQFLQSESIQLAAGIEPMARLELLHRFHGGIVPFPVGCSGEGSIFGESLLNLGDAVGGGSLLPPLPTLGMFAGFFDVRFAAGSRAWRFAGSALRLCRNRFGGRHSRLCR